MADEVFRLPDLGEGLTEAQLVRWQVEEGASVEVNAPLAEVETAKAVVVIPSPWAGTVRTLHARPGESVPVGAPLITIATRSAAPAGPAGGVLVGYGSETPAGHAIRRRPRQPPGPAASGADATRAAPFVRELAKERGVDLSRVRGTGPAGRITRADVEAAGATAPGASPASPVGEARISVVGVRKAIARQMLRSVLTIPQFTEFAIFDATSLLNARAAAKARGIKLTPLPYFIRAIVAAVSRYPLLNSSWDEAKDEIIVKRTVNVGLAVNTTQGLLVPVLRGADRLDFDGIAAGTARLIDGARAGTLTATDMSGGTITVTNVGASGPIETGTPIINPPECCVAGFGGIRPRAMVVDGQAVARESGWISISVDHRIVDGALATQFLTALVQSLEAPDA